MADPGIWQTITSQASALLLGAVGGGAISGWVTWRMLRSGAAQELLRDALAIQAELEAWILEGPDYDQQRLSDHKNLPTDQVSTGLWLRQVEVRVVLDEAYWNSPSEQEYGFIAGKRAWIVRDRITGQAHPGLLTQGWHPALLSSRALENLCGWAERVAVSHDGWLLSKRGLQSLKPLLSALCTSDRLEVLRDRIPSNQTRKFLQDHAKL
jgi:hypothetical protein